MRGDIQIDQRVLGVASVRKIVVADRCSVAGDLRLLLLLLISSEIMRLICLLGRAVNAVIERVIDGVD